MKKKSSPRKKTASKKKSIPKKKRTPKKKIAPKKKAATHSNNWKVVCSVQGVIARGLSRSAAQAQSQSHQLATGHRTTFTSGQ